MAVALTEDDAISLCESPSGLNEVKIGLGRGIPVTDGTDDGLDVSAFLLSKSAKTRSSADGVFYGNHPLRQADGTKYAHRTEALFILATI